VEVYASANMILCVWVERYATFYDAAVIIYFVGRMNYAMMMIFFACSGTMIGHRTAQRLRLDVSRRSLLRRHQMGLRMYYAFVMITLHHLCRLWMR